MTLFLRTWCHSLTGSILTRSTCHEINFHEISLLWDQLNFFCYKKHEMYVTEVKFDTSWHLENHYKAVLSPPHGGHQPWSGGWLCSVHMASTASLNHVIFGITFPMCFNINSAIVALNAVATQLPYCHVHICGLKFDVSWYVVYVLINLKIKNILWSIKVTFFNRKNWWRIDLMRVDLMASWCHESWSRERKPSDYHQVRCLNLMNYIFVLTTASLKN